MGRYENVQIFEDSKRMWETLSRLKEGLRTSLHEQKLIRESEALPSHLGERRYDEPAKLRVSKRRSFEAAQRYMGKKVCVLNFASATNPGGGVVKGSSAQEECLCRCSTLYPNLNCREMWDGFYSPHRRSGNPLHNDDCIYTPGVVVFKTDEATPYLLPERMWYTVDVLTCAAPNLRERPSNEMNPREGKRSVHISEEQLQKLHEKRMRRILDLAVEQKAEVLILGAFGCGAFSNPPEVVARAEKTVVEDYRYCFRDIEFAVYCSPGDDTNYRVFSKIMREESTP